MVSKKSDYLGEKEIWYFGFYRPLDVRYLIKMTWVTKSSAYKLVSLVDDIRLVAGDLALKNYNMAVDRGLSKPYPYSNTQRLIKRLRILKEEYEKKNAEN